MADEPLSDEELAQNRAEAETAAAQWDLLLQLMRAPDGGRLTPGQWAMAQGLPIA